MQNLQNTNSANGNGSEEVRNVLSMEQSSNGNQNNAGDTNNSQRRKTNPIPAKNARNTLMKNINDEGKPRQFFGNSKNLKNQYGSTSTANFINGKPNNGNNATEGNCPNHDDQNEADDDSSFYLSNVQSSQKLNGSSSFGLVASSKQNIKSDSFNGTSEEFKNQAKAFSFMESGMKPKAKNSSNVGSFLANGNSYQHFGPPQQPNQIPHGGDRAPTCGASARNSGMLSSKPSQRGSGTLGTVRSNTDNHASQRKHKNHKSSGAKSSKLSDIKESNSQNIRSNEDNGISIPQSACMDGEINLKNESRNDDLDSEIKDRVDSLQNHDGAGAGVILDSRGPIAEEEAGDLDNDGPYNFKMEQMDSFMDSDEGGLGLSHGSHKFRKNSGEQFKNPMDVVHQVCKGKNDGKSMPLSRMVRRQIYDNFAESSGASKNLLGNSSVALSASQDNS